MSELKQYRCGYIAIVGRPNVGKSTLLNKLLGIHLSITSKKPQTTQHRILGIKSTEQYQAIFVDTPGLHFEHKSAIHRHMNREAMNTLEGVDVVVVMLEGKKQAMREELQVIERCNAMKIPLIILLNKIDLIKNKQQLFPLLNDLGQQFSDAAEIIPVSAKKDRDVSRFEKTVVQYLPESPAFYDTEQLTDKPDAFIAAEMIREQIMRSLNQELPYAMAVEIEAFEEQAEMIKISALIWVEREQQKSILIGQQGEQIKRIGSKARQSMEQYFVKKVFLKLWVKERSGWSDDERALKSLGFGDDSA